MHNPRSQGVSYLICKGGGSYGILTTVKGFKVYGVCLMKDLSKPYKWFLTRPWDNMSTEFRLIDPDGEEVLVIKTARNMSLEEMVGYVLRSKVSQEN